MENISKKKRKNTSVSSPLWTPSTTSGSTNSSHSPQSTIQSYTIQPQQQQQTTKKQKQFVPSPIGFTNSETTGSPIPETPTNQAAGTTPSVTASGSASISTATNYNNPQTVQSDDSIPAMDDFKVSRVASRAAGINRQPNLGSRSESESFPGSASASTSANNDGSLGGMNVFPVSSSVPGSTSGSTAAGVHINSLLNGLNAPGSRSGSIFTANGAADVANPPTGSGSGAGTAGVAVGSAQGVNAALTPETQQQNFLNDLFSQIDSDVMNFQINGGNFMDMVETPGGSTSGASNGNFPGLNFFGEEGYGFW
ncbi:unnamed protein product [Ambrosiozyma monospora]|uniref:Unnamed protein product n=1 Tax=Ambrosiozyma monospora TaxID=43982 RepID=A0ACB5TJF0_AMBMO|nr:unnamed protein product [Ambrosiozyma monospora]